MAKKPRKLNNGGGIGRVSALMSSAAPSAKHDLFLIDDETINDPRIKDQIFCPVIEGQIKGHGMKPRQHSIYPPEMFAAPSAIPIIPASEREARAKELAERGGTLRQMLQAAGIPSMDQDGQGYCWGHSTTGAEQTARCKAGLPYVPLSAFSVCSTIKRGRDEGGWCGLSAQFLRTKGVMPQSVWPQGDYRNPSKYDTPENWARAARFKTTGEYVDLTRDVYDVNLTLDMIDSLGLMGMPMAWDFNWWGHSVMGLDAVFPEAGSVARQGRNSWGDSWQNGGWFVLRGSKAVPDSALCIYMAVAS